MLLNPPDMELLFPFVESALPVAYGVLGVLLFHVVYHENGDLSMYYHSFDVEKGHFAIGIVKSRDGIRWLKLGKIMGGGKPGSFDELGVMNACVARNRRDGNYLMAYEGVAADGKRSIGMAVAPDGLKQWVRLQDEAVLNPAEKGSWRWKDRRSNRNGSF